MHEIDGMLADSEVALRGRGKRGIWADEGSLFTNLPSQGDLKKLQDQIDNLLPAIRTASKAWSSGTSEFISAIQVQEKRVNAVYELLNFTRSDLRVFNEDILEIVKERNVRTSLIGLVITTLKKTTFQFIQLEGLYRAVEDLLRRKLPHYLLPYDELHRALHRLQNHLTKFESDLVNAETDPWYFYSFADFRPFRYKDYLIINLRVPLTTEALNYKYSVLNFVPIFLASPGNDGSHYTKLTTDIECIVYNPHSPQFVVIKRGQRTPHDILWVLSESDLLPQSRSIRTCASALLDANLADIKKLCGYQLIYKTLPPSVTRLSTTNVLVNNQQDIVMKCNGGAYTEHINRSEIQFVISIDCYCSLHIGPYLFLNEELRCENGTRNETTGINIWFLLNIPYLSSIFSDHWMFHLNPNHLFNYSVPVRLPALSVNSKKVQGLLVGDGSLQFSLEATVNQSLRSESVYNGLSYYIFDKMVEMKGSSEGGVNFLSWRDWLLFIVALVLVVNVFWTLIIHFKMRALYIMLPAVPAAASVFTPPPQFVFYLPTMPVNNQTTPTTYTEILRIFQLYAPTEVILVAALIVVVSILLGLVVFKRLKRPSW